MHTSQKHVHFNDNSEFFFIPVEDRNGEWMTYAIDRDILRRIQQTESLISPILQKKLDSTRI